MSHDLPSNIRDRTNFGEQAWDWAFLNPAFVDSNGGQAKLCDLDGFLEQWGHLLGVEAKPGGFRFPEGNAQKRSLSVFASRPGQIVLILYGYNPTNPTVTEWQVSYDGTFGRVEPTNTETVLSWCASWFNHARSRCAADSCQWTGPPQHS